MLSHRNVISLLSTNVLELFEDDISFNFLPMAHVAEKMAGFYARMDLGMYAHLQIYLSHIFYRSYQCVCYIYTTGVARVTRGSSYPIRLCSSHL